MQIPLQSFVTIFKSIASYARKPVHIVILAAFVGAFGLALDAFQIFYNYIPHFIAVSSAILLFLIVWAVFTLEKYEIEEEKGKTLKYLTPILYYSLATFFFCLFMGGIALVADDPEQDLKTVKKIESDVEQIPDRLLQALKHDQQESKQNSLGPYEDELSKAVMENYGFSNVLKTKKISCDFIRYQTYSCQYEVTYFSKCVASLYFCMMEGFPSSRENPLSETSKGVFTKVNDETWALSNIEVLKKELPYVLAEEEPDRETIENYLHYVKPTKDRFTSYYKNFYEKYDLTYEKYDLTYENYEQTAWWRHSKSYRAAVNHNRTKNSIEEFPVFVPKKADWYTKSACEPVNPASYECKYEIHYKSEWEKRLYAEFTGTFVKLPQNLWRLTKETVIETDDPNMEEIKTWEHPSLAKDTK